MSGHFSFPEVLDIEDETVEETSVVKAATPPPQHPPVPPAALPLDEVTEELDREDAAFRERFERLQLWRIGQYESLDEWKLLHDMEMLDKQERKMLRQIAFHTPASFHQYRKSSTSMMSFNSHSRGVGGRTSSLYKGVTPNDRNHSQHTSNQQQQQQHHHHHHHQPHNTSHHPSSPRKSSPLIAGGDQGQRARVAPSPRRPLPIIQQSKARQQRVEEAKQQLLAQQAEQRREREAQKERNAQLAAKAVSKDPSKRIATQYVTGRLSSTLAPIQSAKGVSKPPTT